MGVKVKLIRKKKQLLYLLPWKLFHKSHGPLQAGPNNGVSDSCVSMAPNDIRPKSSWFITSACLSNSMHGNPPTRGIRWYIGYGSKLGAQKRRLYVHYSTFSNSGVLSGVLIWPNPILICLVQWHVMVFFKTGIHTYGQWNVETNYSICIHIALLVPTPQLALVTTVLAPWPLNSVYNYCVIILYQITCQILLIAPLLCSITTMFVSTTHSWWPHHFEGPLNKSLPFSTTCLTFWSRVTFPSYEEDPF